jgi:hypothetical protein
MLFSLPTNPTPSDMSEALNYLLNNFGSNISINVGTGSVAGPTGNISYLYQYLDIKYAQSFDGSVGFSNVPTGATYFGIRNSDSPTESTNPSDYLWEQVTGGFGTTKFVYYSTGGGRTISLQVATTSPGAAWQIDPGTAINLDVVTGVNAYNAAIPVIFQWTTGSAPARPSTTSTYTWATASYTAPSGWYTSPPSDTTPGDTLWAIYVPIVALANVTSSTVDWTNSSYAIVQISKNGSAGPTGSNGLSAITAYLQQSQAAGTPTFSTPTTGPNAPSGWSLTSPTPIVGDTIWIINGQYNSSSSAISGIPAGDTAWTGPLAVSVFQDIESDNWNGSVPPTYGTPSTYGTTGYYISRSTGNCYFNNGVFRGDINTNGQGIFLGRNYQASSVYVGGTTYPTQYAIAGLSTTSPTSSAYTRSGLYGLCQTSGAQYNVGVVGQGVSDISSSTLNGIGVVGAGDLFGGYFSNGSYGSTTVGLAANHSLGGVAFQIGTGQFQFGTTYIQQPPNNSGYYLRGDGVWAATSTITSGVSSFNTRTGAVTLSVSDLIATAPGPGYLLESGGWINDAIVPVSFPTNSGTATVASNILNLLGSTATGIAGAYIGVSGSGNTATFGVQTTSPSDIRLKEEVADIDVGLDFVKKLRPVSYKLKADPKHQKGYGFIADEVEPLVEKDTSLVYFEPDWQVGGQTGFKTIHYPSYVAVLTKAIQELSAEVEQLKLALNQKSS